MIEVKTFSQIGNNLFQYAMGRILAEEMGYALTVRMSARERFRNNNLQLTELMRRFHDAPLVIEGKSFDEPVERFSVFEGSGFDGYNLDVERIVNNTAPRKIVLEGYFEKYRYFKARKSRLRDWFHLEPRSFGYPVSDQDILIHVRRGDYRREGRAIKLDFYTDVLKGLAWKKIYICGDDFDEEVRGRFKKYQPVFVRNSPPDDFCFVQAFRRIIQSQSTFIWWAAFISAADEIYAPVPGPHPAALRLPHIDLRIDDEPRYRYIENVPVDYGAERFGSKARFWAARVLGRRKYEAVARGVKSVKRALGPRSCGRD
jgi:hypothetical protein